MVRAAFVSAVVLIGQGAVAGSYAIAAPVRAIGGEAARSDVLFAGRSSAPVARAPAIAPARPLSPLLQLYEQPGASVDVSLHARRAAHPAAAREPHGVPSATVDLPSAPARSAPQPPRMLRQAPRRGVVIATGAAGPHAYDAAVAGVARMYDIDPAFMGALVRQESGFHPGAVSAKGARGLMQVMPGTARRFGVDGRALQNPVVNLAVGAVYLKSLQRRYGNNLPLVLAAYNAGEGAVDRHGRRVPPYRETRTYVSSILTQYRTGLYAGRTSAR